LCGDGIRQKEKRWRRLQRKFGEVQCGKAAFKMKTKVLLAIVALSYAPLVVTGDEAAYPKEKLAAFVVKKMDLTSLPSAFRPKKEKGKKTLADYGFTAQTVNENEAVTIRCIDFSS